MVLSAEHMAWLSDRGICDDCAFTNGFESVLGGMKISYPGMDFYRVKLDSPTGKQKYTQESGISPRLYFANGYDKWGAGMEPVFVVEGELKAASLACRLRARAGVVGLGGVWNWVGAKDRDRRILISDFDRVRWRGRRVYIVFDSDAGRNSSVLLAERELSAALSDSGARVGIVVLGPERKGIDDWIRAWGDDWEKELMRLCLESRPSREQLLHAVYDRVYSFEDMLSQRFPMPEFYCGDPELGLVGQGMITIVHGPTNVGKTYLATQLAMSIAAGGEFLGHPCKRSKVLVLQGELPPGLYAHSRLRPLTPIHGVPNTIWFYNWTFNLAESSRYKETFTGDAWAGFDRLERMLDMHAPDVIIIDPLQSYHNLVEVSNDQLRELLKRMKSMAISRNIGFILVDHDRKASGDGNASVRGASAKTDMADCVLGISRDDTVSLSYDKVRYISTALPARRDIYMRNGWFFPGADPTLTPPESAQWYGGDE